MDNIRAVVLAAGKGTRMNSDEPKCAHYIIDKTMIEYVIDSLNEAKVDDIITVVGYRSEVIEELVKGRSRFVYQKEQLGTAHAVLMAEELLKDKDGITLIAIGDMPFVSKTTYSSLIAAHIQEKADLTVLTTDHPQPYGYGRIVRDENDEVLEIVEEKDCNKLQRAIQEINASIYLVDNKKLFESIREIQSSNHQNEFYLTDIVKIFRKKNHKIHAYKASNYLEISGVNDKVQLAEMEEALRKKILKKHLLNGVTIHNPATVTIGVDVKIASGAIIRENTLIVSKSIIEKNCKLGPFTEIKNSVIGEGAAVKFSYVKDSIIEANSKIGPFEYIDNNKQVKR